MNPDHGQALLPVFGGPLAHVGQSSKPIDARVGPELHRHDASLEPLWCKRLGAQPTGGALEGRQAALARQDCRSGLPVCGEEVQEGAHRKPPPPSRYGARNSLSAASISLGACPARQWPEPGPSGIGSRVEVELMTIPFHSTVI